MGQKNQKNYEKFLKKTQKMPIFFQYYKNNN